MASLLAASPAVADSGPSAPVKSVTSAVVPGGMVKTAAVVGFDRSNIISDSLFYDGAAMTSAQIQAFLDAKIGTCNNGKCLNVLSAGISSRDAVISRTTGNLICSAIQGGTMRVSELIYRVQVACGISAKVILVTLQKEQGLTTSKAPSDWNLSAAMGASCPDSAPCDPAFSGVGPQILKGTQQLKTYKAANFAKQPGTNYIGFSPNTSCGGTNIDIQNYATAALYNYTPYQPNAAALAAGYGLGDGCSSYGNRNFYNYYTSWFGSVRGQVDPVGQITGWDLTDQGIRIRGWVVDPDTTDAVSVRIKSGETVLARAAANVAGVSAPGYEGYGSSRGIDVVVPLAPGVQTVCVAANNVGAGANRTLGCATVTPTGGSPYGAVTGWEPTPTGVRISGWAIDPDTTGAATVRVKSGDTTLARAIADQPVAALATSHVAFGTAHGFSVEVHIGPASQELCIAVNNLGVGSNRTIGCKAVTAGGGDPVGAVDSWTPTVGGVRIVGWAVDPDTADSVSVRVKAGSSTTRVVADLSRADVGASLPGYGDAHGFDVTVPLPPGSTQVCVATNNVGIGVNRTLGCSTVEVLSGDPFGAVVLTPTVTGVHISGWVIDPDTADPVSVRVKAGATQVARITADAERADLATTYPAYGTRHGFDSDVTLSPGDHEVCVATNNVGPGVNSFLGCTAVTIRAGDPFGAIESWTRTATGMRVSGWVIDPDIAGAASVRVKIGDLTALRLTATESRSTLAGRFPAYGDRHGFTADLTLLTGTQTICIAANNVGAGVNRTLGCTTVTVRGGSPVGAVDAWTVVPGGVNVSGWAFDPDSSDPVGIRVKDGSALVVRLRADVAPADTTSTVARYGPGHGFAGFVPLAAGVHSLCVVANNVGIGQSRTLACSSVTIAP